MKSQIPVFSVLVLWAPSVGAASTEASDWFASLYTDGGIELRADERVFTLYALLNAMGYDEGPIARRHPLPRYRFHPVRAEIREKLLSGDAQVLRQASAFFDAHPLPIPTYLAYTLQSSPPPFAAGARTKELQDLKGLEALLQAAHGQWHLGDLMAQVHGEYRKALRAYLPLVDRPILEARRLLRVPDDGPRALVVMNLLEAENKVTATLGDGEVVVVVGPSSKPDMDRLVTEYARVQVEPAVSQNAQNGWPGGGALLREAQLVGVAETTVGAYATTLLARAVALRALNAPQTAYDAAAQQGYYGLKEIAQKLDDPRPIAAWAIDALQRAEIRRAVRK